MHLVALFIVKNIVNFETTIVSCNNIIKTLILNIHDR